MIINNSQEIVYPLISNNYDFWLKLFIHNAYRINTISTIDNKTLK